MRLGIPAAIALAAIGGCGRIGYEAVDRRDAAAGAGGAGGVAGVGGAGGMAGTGGTAGASGGAGAGGSTGGVGLDGGPDGGSCTTTIYAGHTYALCDGPLSWNDAQNDCAAKGMRLVRIDDAQESQWVLTTAFASVPAGNNQAVNWRWLGGSDVAVPGEWRWTDGALFWLGGSNGSTQNGLYVNWVNGSPTDTGGATDCAIMQHNTQGFWTDTDCGRLQPYVCEQY
jgi:Lectin C-type domain